jgi:hypothetical protein
MLLFVMGLCIWVEIGLEEKGRRCVKREVMRGRRREEARMKVIAVNKSTTMEMTRSRENARLGREGVDSTPGEFGWC